MRDFDLALDKIAYATAIDRMAPYFQLATSRDISETIALQSVQGFRTSTPTSANRPPSEVTSLVDALINTQDGAFTTVDLARRLNYIYTHTQETPVTTTTVRANNTTGGSENDTYGQRLARIFTIYGPGSGAHPPFYKPVMNEVLGRPSGQGGFINSNPGTPSKTAPGLSVIFVNTSQVMPASKNVNAVTLFLNALPSIEISRAIPFVKIQFLFGREPTDSNNRLQTLSLFKFLEGAVHVGTSGTQRLMADLNTTSGSINGGRSSNSGILSTTGMELFYSPQTLVNANESYNNELRAVPVIDPFKPFMTFKSLNIDIAPSVGIMSYKTAKMDFVLHDRSRLHEIADFVKPDLYGTTELFLEYGWSHPDVPGEGTDTATTMTTNPYGLLINGMRCKEKYGIRNVSFTFDDAGQVNVTLDLFMKGGNDFYTETISQHEEGVDNALRTIENLARTVATYERRAFGGRAGAQTTPARHTREIRGTQILEAASDWGSNLRLTPGVLENLEHLTADLRSTSTPAVSALTTALRDLYGARTGTGARVTEGGGLARLSTTIQRSIEGRFQRLNQSEDPFLPPIEPGVVRQEASIHFRRHRNSGEGTTAAQRRAGRDTETGPRNNAVNEEEINLHNFGAQLSLAKLLLIFVGEPLASTGKYDDVQFVFYPFNEYAGFANTINIGQFPVDTRYFVQQYTRYRTENLSRAANMNLRDFLGFVAATLIDDPGATIYGIHSAYHLALDRSTGIDAVVANGNAVDFQTAIENRLRTRTPDASFKMPQVDFYLECLPGKNVIEDGTVAANPTASILKIHIFDRHATQYNTQAGLLAATREETLNTIGSLPQQVDDGEPGIRESHRATNAHILSLASNLVERVNPNSVNTSGAGHAYRIKGGPREIKDFVMSTMPYILYGVQGSAIKGGANLSSQQDPALSTVNMLRSFRAGPLQANGEQPGGLPLSIIPCELSMNTHGCPLIDFAQQFFVDFGTGTTADNIYGVTALSHKFTPGDFTTDIKFAPMDAYGKYSSLIERLNLAADRLEATPPEATPAAPIT